MTTEHIRLRSEFLNTQVITRSTGKRLGVVKQLLVDIDQREVVALGLRDNLLSVAGMPHYMLLSEIQQIGDVILVEDEDAIEEIEVDAYSQLINNEVVTETGELLGKVRDFQFHMEDGKVSSLIIASLGYPQIPDHVLSTYELPIEDIVSSGPNRIIVFEGAEERLTQLTVGWLERLGIGKPPWEKEEEDLYYAPTTRPENQLGTGIPNRSQKSRASETEAPVYEDAWAEEEWDEPEPEPRYRRQREPVRYDKEAFEEDNWSDVPAAPYEEPAYEPELIEQNYERAYEYDEDVQADAWEDKSKSEPYQPPRINLPEKTKAPEYEEEAGY
ncbi:MAG: photosystem reaction center subunit H [Cyanobacteria bacterium QS_7_48_42]|jgi:sporulation protein YlmC with PRC-barrel domain|nr:MAG: photosystem reaction center subunit H [Cyanobacteria bacterium QH_7_48_89]PSO58344.1 MAG: photosystem reaction center subunit H [Cyanobacteria bacterium QH_10_48_56]PSO71927.1 MAG: photosystem reaction center subunit H [Cyanobacteria bacterium QS_1_48_34]PSO76849.1 MAG: photosystem reaction center subunit H [Cyanobacteria bacterium QH_3_48_40]PSP00370.1 MAG: photosystem reaction center subunit H [Cyanobacteria bacterium QS_7_48_42]